MHRLIRRHFRLPLAASAAALLLAGCGLFDQQRTPSIERGQGPVEQHAVAKPDHHSFRVGPFLFHSDVPLEKSDPLFRELEELPEQIERELRLPLSQSPIHVYLFEEQDRYEKYIHSRDKDLPSRPAYFFAEPRGAGLPDDLLVFTWLGKRLRADLRHELTHALLHGVIKNVPLWLDEGLAGYFEQPPGSDGVNPLHLAALRAPSFRPNLARLEKMDKVQQMGRLEYQEAWGWVHFMLRGPAKIRGPFLDYLQALRSSTTPGTLESRLTPILPDLNSALMDYLGTIR